MKPVSGFIADDGTFFQTEHEARAHESMKDRVMFIDSFLDSSANLYASGAHKGIIRNSIISWEIWKENTNVK